MNNLEKLEFIDELLMRLEDFTHGEDGKDITISRKYINDLRKESHLNKEMLIAYRDRIDCDDIDKLTGRQVLDDLNDYHNL